MSPMALRLSRLALASLLFASLGTITACNDDDDVTGTGGALVRLGLDAPETVSSGQTFSLNVTAQNIGVTNVRNGVVTVTLGAPLTVVSFNADAGTSATVSGSTVTWQLNTLDSNTTSELNIQSVGTLAPGAPNLPVAIQASLTADGIRPGESVADDTVTLTQ
jgi:Domain of unknown function DUF11